MITRKYYKPDGGIVCEYEDGTTSGDCENYCLSSDVVENDDGSATVPKIKNARNAEKLYLMDKTANDSGNLVHKVYCYNQENGTWLLQ